MHALPLRLLGLVVLLCLSLAGCASSKLVNEWSNPEYSSVHFSNVLVIGVSTQAGVRRTFEDELVAKLEAGQLIDTGAGYGARFPGQRTCTADCIRLSVRCESAPLPAARPEPVKQAMKRVGE
jgi:hypothetical protein